MVLPFVRDLFADVEKLSAFSRVASHLKESTGRIRVSGLIPTGKALLLVLLQRAAGRPLILIVPDNRTAEDLVPVLQAFHELTGGNDPGSIVALPLAMSCPSRIFRHIQKFRKNVLLHCGRSRPERHRLSLRRLHQQRCDSVPRNITPTWREPSAVAKQSMLILY